MSGTFKIRNGLKQTVPENMQHPDEVRPTGYELADVIEYSTFSPYNYRSSLRDKGGDFTMYYSYVYELKSKHSKNEELPKHIYYIKNKTYTEGVYMKEGSCDEKDKYVIYDFNHSTKNSRIVLCRVYEPNVKSSSSRTSTKKSSYSLLKGGIKKYNKTKGKKRTRTRRRY